MKTPNHACSEAGVELHQTRSQARAVRGKSAAVAVLLGAALMLGGCGEHLATEGTTPARTEAASSSPRAAAVPRLLGTLTSTQPSKAVEPELRLMEEGQFWDIVDRSRESSNGSIEHQASELEDALAALPPTQVASFNATFVSKNLELYSWELWGAVYVLYGGCSDDCFEYFRNWVVSQGQDYFKAVQRDPQVLDDGRLSYAFETDEAEWLSWVGEDAYSRASHGRDLYEDYPQSPMTLSGGEPSGTAWDEEEVESLYPDLVPLL